MRNLHELKTNQKALVNEKEHWCLALEKSTAGFRFNNQISTYIKDLDRRISNIQWLIDIEEGKTNGML